MLAELVFVAAALAAPPEPAVVYLPAAPTTLHPLFAVRPTDRLVHSLVHDRLFHAAADEPWSRLVDSWAVEGTEVQLTLHRGRSWHDGHPIDAGDVCYTLDTLLQPRSLSPDGPRVRASVASCRTSPDDPRTAVITLWEQATHQQVARLLTVPLAAQHVYGGPGAEGDPRRQHHAIGAGPYRLAERHPDGVLELSATDRQLPFATLWLAPAADPYANAWSLADGGATATAWVPPAALPMVRAATEVGLYPWDRWVAWSLALNLHRPPLDVPEVRRGLDLLLDRPALRRALAGGDDPDRDDPPWPLVSGPFRAGSDRLSAGIRPPTRTPEAAAAQLRAAGWSLDDRGQWRDATGEPVVLTVAVPRHAVVHPEAVGPALGLDGIEVVVEPVGPSEWLASVWAGGHRDHCDAVLLPRPLYPTDDPSPWFATRSERTGWGNVFDVSDPAVDSLITRAQGDDAEALAASRQLHGELADRRWHLFLFEERAWTAWRGPWATWVPAPYDGWSRIDRWRR